jgi:hypothetical protein
LELRIYNVSCHFLIFSGFTISGGVPKVGQLLNAAWNLTDMCRFKLVTAPAPTPHHSASSTPEHRRGADSSSSNNTTSGVTTASSLPAPGSSANKNSLHKETADRLDMPPPPSPASSTCSDTGSITTSHSMCTHIVPAHCVVSFIMCALHISVQFTFHMHVFVLILTYFISVSRCMER